MEEYVERFSISYEEAKKVKYEIYSLDILNIEKDRLWEKIVMYCLQNKLAMWYFK